MRTSVPSQDLATRCGSRETRRGAGAMGLWLRGTLGIWLVLFVLSLPAWGGQDGLENWGRFGAEHSDPEVREAIAYLRVRESILLRSSGIWRLCRDAFNEKSRPEMRERAQRQLVLLRLGHVLDAGRVRDSVQKLTGLEDARPGGKLDKLASEAGPPPIDKGEMTARIQALVERGTLFLEVDTRLLFMPHRFQALACWANQKVVAGATEMYNLDNPGKEPEQLDQAFFETLLKKGLLKQVPTDPGYGEGSQSHYRLTPDKQVFCTHHGLVSPPAEIDADTTPRMQLEALGVKDEELLDLCADLPLVPKHMRGGPDILR